MTESKWARALSHWAGLRIEAHSSHGGKYRYPIIILFAVALHVIWSVTFFFDPSSAQATAPATLVNIVGSTDIAALMFLLAAGSAAVGLFTKERMSAVLLMVPQQVLLFVSATGAFIAVLNGAFADGTIRSSAFLLVDQCPSILAAIGHTAAIILVARSK